MDGEIEDAIVLAVLYAGAMEPLRIILGLEDAGRSDWCATVAGALVMAASVLIPDSSPGLWVMGVLLVLRTVPGMMRSAPASGPWIWYLLLIPLLEMIASRPGDSGMLPAIWFFVALLVTLPFVFILGRRRIGRLAAEGHVEPLRRLRERRSTSPGEWMWILLTLPAFGVMNRIWLSGHPVILMLVVGVSGAIVVSVMTTGRFVGRVVRASEVPMVNPSTIDRWQVIGLVVGTVLVIAGFA